MPSGDPPRDASASVAPQDTSPLPPQSPASAWQSSGSVGPATPAGRAAAGSPMVLIGSPPVVPVPLPATTSSSSAALRSEPPLAVGSSSRYAPAPSGVGATAVAADPDSPSSAPRSAESHLSSSIAVSAAHPGDPSSACVPASH